MIGVGKGKGIGRIGINNKKKTKLAGRVDIAVCRMVERIMDGANGPVKELWEAYKRDIEDELMETFGRLNIPSKYVELMHKVVNKGEGYGNDRIR